jgi:hypothetical protein
MSHSGAAAEGYLKTVMGRGLYARPLEKRQG